MATALHAIATVRTTGLQGRTQMFARTLIVAGGLVLALVGAPAAQTVVTGTVTRIDQPASVIVLQDGRMVRVPGGMGLINGQPTAISTIQPGTLGAIQTGRDVA